MCVRVSVFLYVHMGMGCLCKPEEWVGSPRPGLTNGCEQSELGAGNKTQEISQVVCLLPTDPPL